MTKRSLLLAAAAVLALSATAGAQENYTLPAGAGNVVTISTLIAKGARDTCLRFNLLATCTQAEACQAAGAVGGTGCTAAQARAANARIYPNTFAGREEFTTFEIALPRFVELVASQQAEDRRAFCVAWNAASVGTRNAFCTSISLAAGCNPGC